MNIVKDILEHHAAPARRELAERALGGEALGPIHVRTLGALVLASNQAVADLVEHIAALAQQIADLRAALAKSGAPNPVDHQAPESGNKLCVWVLCTEATFDPGKGRVVRCGGAGFTDLADAWDHLARFQRCWCGAASVIVPGTHPWVRELP